MHLLEAVATPEQKERYLRPLARGDARSCFAMTEPAPGAGSDPAALSTIARRRRRGGWLVNGRKWFITGADGAAFTICMARTSGSPGDRGGATMFLIDADTPGMTIIRHIDTLDEGFFGGHCELDFEDVFVPEAAVLGAVDQGFDYAQVRLAPARLTHCMRWLGIARHAQEIAVERAAERELFGSRLGDLGMVQAMVADSEIDLAASRLLILQACAELDQGRSAAQSSSIAKTFVAEAVGRVVDRSVQICGALGISGDVLLSRYLREVRPFRIYDGSSETHRWAIAKRRLRAATPVAAELVTPVTGQFAHALTAPHFHFRLKWIQFNSGRGPVHDCYRPRRAREGRRDRPRVAQPAAQEERRHRRAAAPARRDHREVDEDPELKVLVLRGRENTFCSGFDLDELLADYVGTTTAMEVAVLSAKVCDRLYSMNTPSVAVLEGYVTAGGFELMISCDFAVAADDAQIGDFHIRRALFGGAGPIYRLPRMIGIRKTKELMLTGKLLSGKEAVDFDLINASAPAEELDQLVEDFIAPIIDKSPFAMRLTKMTIDRGLDADIQSLMVMEHLAVGNALQSEDAREGVNAFLEKREPKWVGR